MPPSWLSEMCQRGDAELRGPAGDRAAHLQVRTTVRADDDLGVVPVQVAGAPSALASASLAANRAARDSPVRRVPDGVCCSASVNSRSRSPGVRVSDSAKRSTGTTSIPTPMITGSVCRVPSRPAHRSASWLTVWVLAHRRH